MEHALMRVHERPSVLHVEMADIARSDHTVGPNCMLSKAKNQGDEKGGSADKLNQ